MLPVRLHGRAAPISALQVSAQGCVFVHLVEMLLDPLLPEVDKRAEQRRYQQQHGVGERSIRGYLLRYRTRGPRSLLFYRPRPTSARVHDAALREKLLELINELPTRSVPQLRKLIAPTPDSAPRSRASRIAPATACSPTISAPPSAPSRRPTPWLWCRTVTRYLGLRPAMICAAAGATLSPER